MLISGEHRRRNIPGAAFRKGAGKLLANAARGFVSPAVSAHAIPEGRWGIFIFACFHSKLDAGSLRSVCVCAV